MSSPTTAALEVGEFLSRHNIPYVVIGGLAVQFWGEPRMTQDADLTIQSSVDSGVQPIAELLTTHFESRVADPVAFARQSRMILIRTPSGIEVDVSLALPGYEDELFARAITIEIAPGKSIQVCSPEDLIIHKAIAGRPRDEYDISGVVLRQGIRLDLDYLRSWLDQFSNLLEDSRVSERFEISWTEFLGANSE